jgi:hypothetical protein
MAYRFSTLEMQTAWQLKSKGWQHVLYDTDFPALAEMTKWCHDSFGLMYGQADPATWSTDGRWFSCVMNFGTGGTIFNSKAILMFPEKEYSWFLLRWGA